MDATEIQSPRSNHPTTVYSPERLELILQALREGSTRTAAAEAAGVNRVTLYRWIENSLDVCNAVTRAEAESQVFYESAIHKAVAGYDVVEETVRETDKGTFRTQTVKRQWHPDVAQFWLERRRREEYGQRLDVRAIPSEVLLDALQQQQITYPAAPLALLTNESPQTQDTEENNTDSGDADQTDEPSVE